MGGDPSFTLFVRLSFIKDVCKTLCREKFQIAGEVKNGLSIFLTFVQQIYPLDGKKRIVLLRIKKYSKNILCQFTNKRHYFSELDDLGLNKTAKLVVPDVLIVDYLSNVKKIE